MLLAGLSTGHMIGLAVVAAIFIAFALASSFLAPRYRADFPGRAGLSVFVIASLVMFAAMVTAVEIFGAESDTATAAGTPAATTSAAEAGATLRIQEKEFTISLPASAAQTLKPGAYTLQVHNAGTIAHDIAVQAAGGSSAIEKTPLIQPGGDATLKVTLAKGVYDVFCTVPGHRQAGMQTKLTVG